MILCQHVQSSHEHAWKDQNHIPHHDPQLLLVQCERQIKGRQLKRNHKDRGHIQPKGAEDDQKRVDPPRFPFRIQKRLQEAVQQRRNNQNGENCFAFRRADDQKFSCREQVEAEEVQQPEKGEHKSTLCTVPMKKEASDLIHDALVQNDNDRCHNGHILYHRMQMQQLAHDRAVILIGFQQIFRVQVVEELTGIWIVLAERIRIQRSCRVTKVVGLIPDCVGFVIQIKKKDLGGNQDEQHTGAIFLLSGKKRPQTCQPGAEILSLGNKKENRYEYKYNGPHSRQPG